MGDDARVEDAANGRQEVANEENGSAEEPIMNCLFFGEVPAREAVVRTFEKHVWPRQRFNSCVKDGLWEQKQTSMDAAYHVTEESLADELAIEQRVTARVSETLDPERPLWKVTLLRAERPLSRSALLLRLHYCIANGLAGEDALELPPVAEMLRPVKAEVRERSRSPPRSTRDASKRQPLQHKSRCGNAKSKAAAEAAESAGIAAVTEEMKQAAKDASEVVGAVLNSLEELFEVNTNEQGLAAYIEKQIPLQEVAEMLPEALKAYMLPKLDAMNKNRKANSPGTYRNPILEMHACLLTASD